MSDESISSDDEIPILVPFDENKTKESVEQPALLDLPAVPVTILTGFLGSGKTSLIQHILQSPYHGKKIAVIENEFSGASAANPTSIANGSLAEKEGLSIETLIARDGSDNSNLTDLIELPNGCICCTVKDSLVETLENLIDKKRELDYIIIECSGMANPGPIASIFWLDDTLESRIRLDGIVTCVDARNIDMQLHETSSKIEGKNGGDEAAQQIAYADRIIVNKIDLLQKEEAKDPLQNVMNTIRSINSTALIQATSYSRVDDLTWILDSNCFDIEKAQNLESSLSKGSVFQNLNSDDGITLCAPCTIENHSHTNAITSIALIEKGSVCIKKMNTWLASLLWPDQDKDDKILTAELKELERLGKITTEELMERNKRDEVERTMMIFRVKGILSANCSEYADIDDEEYKGFLSENGVDSRKYLVQGVNDLWDINPMKLSEGWKSDEDRICKLVLIGRNLDSSTLCAGFKACIV